MHSTLPVQQDHPQPRARPPAPPARRPGRLAALDGLRLCAALMVVAYHWIAFDSGAWGHRSARALFPTAYLPASYGWLGVQLFFLISGFVICMSGWGKDVGRFAVSRITRLFPAYWFAVPLVALVVRLWPVVNSPTALQDVAVNLTMLQDPLGVEPVDGVYWTLWIEVRFYLLFALVVHKGLDYRRVVAFCGLWGAGAVVARVTGDPLLERVLLPYDCWYFIAGIAFYLMYRFRPAPLLWLIVGGTFLIAQHDLLVAERRAEAYMGHRVPHWPTLALVGVFYLSVMAVALGWTRRLDWRWLSTAGALTYPLYLLHERVGWVVIRHADGHLPRLVLLPLLLVGALTAAWLVHRGIERPLARRLGDALRRAVTRRGAGPPGATGTVRSPGRHRTVGEGRG
ncbi:MULTISPECIES: acyltransferase family protein [Streptomyces]|uniref:acyltransferase family protein n=1 Tax=Streptomyces TaxID=1883 RepID=UPI00163CC3D9|nr:MULTISPECIES: acyltransferase [Streptomyces]MBC2874962.1 acyltransferase [Streptomyces sp. TYQ1024]UBI37402.1 acyltransferase [Streptomyces mobaraensis]UKW29992.1 acyltransferase [Streptomyces sp. TYQ1024]